MKNLIIIIILIRCIPWSYSQNDSTVCIPHKTATIIADSLNMLPQLRGFIHLQHKYQDSLNSRITTLKMEVLNREEQIRIDSRTITLLKLKNASTENKVNIITQDRDFYKKKYKSQKWQKWIGIGIGILVGSAGTIVGYELKK